MAWLFALLFAIVALGLLWRFGKLPRAGIELAVAAALVGIAGYVWQGSPTQAGAPVEAKDKGFVPPDVALRASRAATGNNYGDAAKVAEFADTLDRMGLTREAVIAVKTGMRKDPNNVELWVALGNTLVAHGGGTLSPAAEFAFQHGAQLSPEHPGPPFFMGLALANSGRAEDAGQVWRGLLARTPKEAQWRADLEARLTAIGGMPEPAKVPNAAAK
jgi:cytochrome c-type biogenesis protein CcmH/NrfG